jgi:hypothetical protein
MATAVTLPEEPTAEQSHSAMLPLPPPSARHRQPWPTPESAKVPPRPGVEDLGHQVEPLVLQRRGVIENVRSHGLHGSSPTRSSCQGSRYRYPSRARW